VLNAVLSIAGGLALLAAGAEGLVRGSTALAARLGVTPLVIGLTVVAFGTGSPELVVSLQAAADGRGGIAVGNVIGSNIMNIALVLGIAALVRPLEVRALVTRLEIPVLILASLLGWAFLAGGTLARWQGFVLLAVLALYGGARMFVARRTPSMQILDGFVADVPRRKGGLFRAVAMVASGLLMLVLGARLLVGGAASVAHALGVSEALIGLTVVALGTSLPELATSLVAAVRNQPDIAVGNVVGSCIFNILGILGLTAAVSPVRAAGITPVDLAVMASLAMVTLPIMRSGLRVTRLEGALLVTGFAAYLAWLIHGAVG